MRKSIWLYILVLVLVGPMAFAQFVTFLPNQSKLPVGNVNQVLQDSEGYIWYATNGGGLCRDNGYQIDIFRGYQQGSDTLKSDVVTNIAEDGARHIWIGTIGGLYILDKHDYSIHSITERAFKNTHIRALCSTHDGMIWVATGKQYALFNSNLDILRLYTSDNPGDGSKSINRFYEDANHNVWMMECRRGIQRFDKQTHKFHPIAWAEAEPLCMIQDTRSNCYWVGTWGGGIVKLTFDKRGLPITERQKTNGSQQILSLAIDTPTGDLLAVTMDDIERYATGKSLTLRHNAFHLQPTKKLLSQMSKDKQGNIWVAGHSPHTFIINNTQNRLFRDPIAYIANASGFPTFPVSIVPEGDGLWLWLRRVGLYYYSQRQNLLVYSRYDYGHGTLQGKEILEKCSQQPGIWLADGCRVMHVWMDGPTMRWEQVAKASSEIRKFVDDQKGVLYISTNNGIERYYYLRKQSDYLCITDGPVTQMVVNQKGNVLYVSADNHLMECNTASGRITPVNDEMNIRLIRKDARTGLIYFATSNGLVYSYNQKHDKPQLLISFGNVSFAVKDMVLDSQKHLWIATDQKLLECDTANDIVHSYQSDEPGIDIDQFYTLAVHDNHIYIGGCGALFSTAASPHVISSTRQTPPKVSAVIVDNVTYYSFGEHSTLNIPCTSKMVEIQFTNFEYVHASDQVFAYRIKELGSDWQYLPMGQNNIRLTGLRKGTYTIQLRQPGSCPSSAVITAITINRLPAWWESWWAYIFYALILSATAIAVIRHLYFRQQRKRAEHIERQVQEIKFRFFTNISHELRTPLTLIITPLESFSKSNELLKPILRNAYSLLEMINRLLDFRKLEMGEHKLNMQPGDLGEYIRSAVESFRPLAEKKGISLNNIAEEQHGHIVPFDSQKLHHILFNLLSNAMKYTPEGGSVSIAFQLSSDNIATISVHDTGVGIAPADLPHIFERYYQAQNSVGHDGTGIGLNMVREFAVLHGGDCVVESTLGCGSTFTVTLNVHSVNVGKEKELQANQATAISDNFDISATSEPNLPIVLLVEDNVEFRDFLATEVSHKYIVLQAANGREALRVVADNPNVAIIVSDVMMPEMNGVEMCRILKADVKTSHLPVILLTAQSGEERMLQGYDAGADFYLTKPFSLDLLLGRIQYLLSFADRRKKIFLQSVEVNVEDITANKVDEAFITKAIAAVEKNLTNTDYAVEQLASDMCMSRMNLYRKLTTLTGQKPTEFIRAIRLKKAAQMIVNSKLSISEVAYSTGFSTPSYFTRLFKEMFGVLPSEYKG